MNKYYYSSVLLILLVFLFPLYAEARHFKVYGYKTPDEGEMEVALWNDYVVDSDATMNFFEKAGVKRDGLLSHTLEIEYGMTDRWTIAGYIDLEQPSGEDLKYVQMRTVFSRYRFFEKGERFFDTAVYFEYIIPDSKYQGTPKEKLEVRLILERDLGAATLVINPKFEKVTSGDNNKKGLEFAYGISLYAKSSTSFKPGLEAYGDMGQIARFKPARKQKHYLVPAIKWDLFKEISWNLGVAFGLTRASDDLVVKSILAWEFE